MTPQEKLLEYMLFELTSEGGQPTLNPTTQSFGSRGALASTARAKPSPGPNNPASPRHLVCLSQRRLRHHREHLPSVRPRRRQLHRHRRLRRPPSSARRLERSASLPPGLPSTPHSPAPERPATLSRPRRSRSEPGHRNSASQTITLTQHRRRSVAGPDLWSPPANTPSAPPHAARPSLPAQLAPSRSPSCHRHRIPARNSRSQFHQPPHNGLNATLTATALTSPSPITPLIRNGGSRGFHRPAQHPARHRDPDPLAGFAAPVTVTCTIATTATATACNVATAPVTPPASIVITINTTSQYTVVGYGVAGSRMGCGSSRLPAAASSGAPAVRPAPSAPPSWSSSSPPSAYPSQDAPASFPAERVYTGPGSYVRHGQATDGFLVRPATYTLTVTAH